MYAYKDTPARAGRKDGILALLSKGQVMRAGAGFAGYTLTKYAVEFTEGAISSQSGGFGFLTEWPEVGAAIGAGLIAPMLGSALNNSQVTFGGMIWGFARAFKSVLGRTGITPPFQVIA